MSIFKNRKNLDLESQGITPEILMEIFDIEKISAEEFLDGTISLTRGELREIAKYKGISPEELIYCVTLQSS